MSFPDDILIPKERSDGGVVINETKTIDPTTHTVVLSHYARSREVLSDGRVISSSIVVSKSGQLYTEVFSTPLPDGHYFYHYEDTSTNVDSSVLLFNSTESGDVSISYETRGDYIFASTHNRIENDLAAIENMLSYNNKGFKKILIGQIFDNEWTEYIINSTSVYGKIIDLSDYTEDASTSIVQVNLGYKYSNSVGLPSSVCLSIPGEISGISGSGVSKVLIATYESPGSSTGYKFLNYLIIIP